MNCRMNDTWYHGSPAELIVLRSGSTITRDRHLAEVFSHKPQIVSIDDDGRIRHSGTQPGYLYRIAETVAPDDVYPHPNSSMAPGLEWLTRREPVHTKADNAAYNNGSQFPPAYLALRRFVRGATIESDMHMLSPMEFHASTSRLVQLLRGGHYGVRVDVESWDRLITWIDLNTPAHGTWQEIVGTEKVARQRERRRAMMA